jgi:hypothetical protein
MRGKQGFRQVRNRDSRVIFAGFDADTSNVVVNSATPNSLNGSDPAIIFSGFQNIALPQNTPTSSAPTVRLAATNNRFALLSYSSDTSGYTPTASQIFVSRDATKWRTKTLPTRDTTDPLKHAWAEVYGCNGRIIVSHSHYPDVVIADNSTEWTLLQNVFAVNGFQQNGIAAGNGILLAAADDAKVVYRSLDNGTTWLAIASNILIDEFSGSPRFKALDSILALTYGAFGASNVFFMLARRNDVPRYRYVLTSTDGVTWTQRLRIDLGTTGTPQEPIIASAPNRTAIVLNNLTTATTIITTTAGTWTTVASTPAANWRSVIYDGSKFVACGESFGSTAAAVVMTLNPAAGTPAWTVKLTNTQKLRAVVSGFSTQPQQDASVALLLRMAGDVASSTFVDSSLTPKTITATNVVHSADQTKWPPANSAQFIGADYYLTVAASPAFRTNTDDFTIEAWVWLDSYSDGAFWDKYAYVDWPVYNYRGLLWQLDSAGALKITADGTVYGTTPNAVIPLYSWAHIALVRKNNQIAIYVNGEIQMSAYAPFNDNDANHTTAPRIGTMPEQPWNTGLSGYIGEFRFTNGFAQYNGATFSVPAAPVLNFSALGTPYNVTVSSGYKQLFVAWEPPATTGGERIFDYIVESSTDDGITWAAIADTTSATTSRTVTNLLNGDEYVFRVAAVTEDGVSSYSVVSEPIVVGGDQYFDNVVALLHMDGTNDSITFTDSSAFSRSLTRSGNPQISTTQSQFGGASAYFNGSSYVSMPASADFDFSTSDFTIEGWVYNTHSGYSGIIGSRNNGTGHGWCLYINNNTLRTGSTRGSAGYSDVQLHPTSIAQNTWTHFAVVKTAAGYTAFINGVAGPVLTGGGFQYIPGLPVSVGALASYGELPFLGYIDDIRVTQGVARYTQPTFSVPAAPFPDDGPLSAPTNFNALAQNQSVKLTWQMPKSRGFLPVVDYIVQYSEDAGATWNTAADSVSTATTTTVTGLVNNTNYLFRVAAINDDGTGPYATTAAPVAPTNGDPLFNSVSLLLRFNETNNTFIDTSSQPKTLTANNGGATYNTLSKWGDGSAFFNGGSLTTPSSADFSFGTGDFTIEFWAYPTADTFAGAMINVGYYYDGILFRQRNGSDSLYLNGSWVNWNSPANMPSNVWTHMALVREAGVVAVYANGTRLLTWNNAADLNPSGTFVTIGVGSHSGFGEPFYGYLDELRITKGVARYSGPTATIPTGPFLGAPE